MLTLSQREELRIAILGWLSARHPLPFEPAAIRLHLRRKQALDFEVAPEDISSALVFLKDPGYVAMVPGDLGASQHWSATAAGVLEAERKGYLLP